jgi:hypothetical protein
MAGVKRLLEQRRDAAEAAEMWPENARWDDDDMLVFLTPDQLEREAASMSFEDWGADR